MNRILVVVDQTEKAQKLGVYAATIASGIGADAIVAQFVDETSYQSSLQRIASSQGKEIESIDQAEAKAKAAASQFAAMTFAEFDGDVETVGVVDRMPQGIVTLANDRDCSHVFISSDRSSPAGKALFGNTAQHTILNFDGPVTVTVD